MKLFRRSVWIGLIWTWIAGFLLHFLYGWSGQNRVIGLYSAVSESVWEHLKLLFFPTLVYTIWEYLWIGHRWNGYVLAKAESVLLGMTTIVVLFYTYTGIFGRDWIAADILLFLIGAAVTAWYTWKRVPRNHGNNCIGIWIFVWIAVLFGILTFYPPGFGIFLSA